MNEHPIKSIRRAGVPLTCFETADPAATIVSTIRNLNGKTESIPLLKWDIINGLVGINDIGRVVAQDIAPEGLIQPGDIAEHLKVLANKAPEDSIVFFCNAHRFVDDPAVAQSVFNLRDAFKARHACLVMMAPAMRLPAELKNDVVIINEPLPNSEEIRAIVDSILFDAELADTADDAAKVKMADALLGLAAFPAEQSIALSLSNTGVDIQGLWERKRKMVEQTQGLEVYRGTETYSVVGGNANAKSIFAKTITGKLGITCLVLIDELDKGMAASQTDTSGTTQDQNRVMLSYMQENDICGILELGSPGTGKTLMPKAAANEFGIPLIMLDLGAMKGSLVGQSEQNMRNAMRVIHAISGGRAMFVGACNRTEMLPPELRRRFNYSSIFFDLPDDEEKQSAWKVHTSKYGLTAEQCDTVNDAGWTGAEIRNACMKAWAMDCKLSEAATTIVPISVSASDVVSALRKSASGKYISAARPGLYMYRESSPPLLGRKVVLN
jgi:hypothetical protein